ncbi:MAG: FmdB family zinc ribbon protein [Pirellulaceae bacterium]
MPIYEFYCSDCHAIFNFFARSMHVSKRPGCPRCARPKLERKISRFAIGRGAANESDEDDLPPGFDETKMEQAMEMLAREADGVDEDDPRQAGRMLRKLYEATGMGLDDRMEEAIRRMESGEDPDKIEEEMGDLFDENEDPFSRDSEGGLRGLAKKLRPPEVDETLYDLE